MSSRPAVLLTPPISLRPVLSRSCKQIATPTLLAATLMDLPANAANKRLTTCLTPLAATLTQNEGYILQAKYFSLSLPRTYLCTLPPILRTLFQVPYPATPLFATLAKTAGVCTNNFHCGTRHSALGTRHFVQPLSFHILANSFAPRKNSTLFFSGNSELFSKNHPGWGGGGAPC
jgi:hypothetical protein